MQEHPAAGNEHEAQQRLDDVGVDDVWGAGQQRPPLRPGTLRNQEGRITLARWYRGDPHAALAARPAPSEEDAPR